jgi:threonine dehydrogenase-like Zn-dependent dehydrogenase
MKLSIQQFHSHPVTEARKRLDGFTVKLKEKYDSLVASERHTWLAGKDVMEFTITGVMGRKFNGIIVVDPSSVTLTVSGDIPRLFQWKVREMMEAELERALA